MTFSPKDVLPLTKVRAHLSDLCDEVHETHSTKIITKNGESWAVLIDPPLLEYYQNLERESIHLTLLDEAQTGLRDYREGHTLSLSQLKKKYVSTKT